MPTDRINIDDLRVSCIMGILPHERLTPQTVRVSLSVPVDTREAAALGKLDASLDYAQMARDIAFILQAGHFFLIESAAHMVAAHVKRESGGKPQPEGEPVRVSIAKPEALGGNGVPNVEVARTSAPPLAQTLFQDGVSAETVYECQDAGLYRMTVAQGAKFTTRGLAGHRFSDAVRSEGLSCAGRPRQPNAFVSWAENSTIGWENTSATEQTLLRMSRPPLYARDWRAIRATHGGEEPSAPQAETKFFAGVATPHTQENKKP